MLKPVVTHSSVFHSVYFLCLTFGGFFYKGKSVESDDNLSRCFLVFSAVFLQSIQGKNSLLTWMIVTIENFQAWTHLIYDDAALTHSPRRQFIYKHRFKIRFCYVDLISAVLSQNNLSIHKPGTIDSIRHPKVIRFYRIYDAHKFCSDFHAC